MCARKGDSDEIQMAVSKQRVRAVEDRMNWDRHPLCDESFSQTDPLKSGQIQSFAIDFECRKESHITILSVYPRGMRDRSNTTG
jgi:hypothetical protein